AIHHRRARRDAWRLGATGGAYAVSGDAADGARSVVGARRRPPTRGHRRRRRRLSAGPVGPRRHRRPAAAAHRPVRPPVVPAAALYARFAAFPLRTWTP